jgi:hypothetical protein
VYYYACDTLLCFDPNGLKKASQIDTKKKISP